MIDTETGSHRILFEEHFTILKSTMNGQGKRQDCFEERMQNANKSWWRDVNIYRCKDVPWRAKCRRMVEQVFCVFYFGSDKWSFWTKSEDGKQWR